MRVASETDIQTLTPQQLADLSMVARGYGRGMDLPAGSPTAWLVPDVDAYASAFNIYSNTGLYRLGSIEQSDARGGNFAVEEEDLGQYVQGEFELTVPRAHIARAMSASGTSGPISSRPVSQRWRLGASGRR